MGYAAITVALLGMIVGTMLRLKALLAFVGLLLVASIALSLWQGFSFVETATTVFIGQVILQSSYFVGLLARSALTGHRWNRRLI
jgi:hypothetical protein